MPDTAQQPPKDLIGFLDFYLVKKAPFQIPDNAKEALVKYGPIILLVVVVLQLPFLLVALGIGTAFMPFGGFTYASMFWYVAVFLVISIGLEIAALPGLFKRKMSGWTLLFYGRLVTIVFQLSSGAIIGAILGGLISLYLLFQVREKYS